MNVCCGKVRRDIYRFKGPSSWETKQRRRWGRAKRNLWEKCKTLTTGAVKPYILLVLKIVLRIFLFFCAFFFSELSSQIYMVSEVSLTITQTESESVMLYKQSVTCSSNNGKKCNACLSEIKHEIMKQNDECAWWMIHLEKCLHAR